LNLKKALNLDLQRAVERNCHWCPDYAWISLLKPQPGRAMRIGPRQTLNINDAANQTLALSAVTSVFIEPNAILAASWTKPAPNQAIFFENIGFGLQNVDASGKLQLLSVTQATIGNLTGAPITGLSAPLPFTFPALANFQLWWNLVNPVPLWTTQVGAFGPFCFALLNNTDAGAGHTFKRLVSLTWRVIDNVDFSSGPAIPGAGISAEFA
jgi:hypothetical protein